MIYQTLRILPMVVFMEIAKSGDVTLLSDEETPIEELAVLWEELQEKHEGFSHNPNADKVFKVSKEVDFQANRYELIHHACESLSFEKDERLIEILQEYGYTITDKNYINDLNKVIRQSEGILTRINQLKDTLPKQPKEGTETSIVEVIASYSSILGFDFDYFTCSVEKFYALEKMVKAKIKSLESTNQKSKK